MKSGVWVVAKIGQQSKVHEEMTVNLSCVNVEFGS